MCVHAPRRDKSLTMMSFPAIVVSFSCSKQTTLGVQCKRRHTKANILRFSSVNKPVHLYCVTYTMFFYNGASTQEMTSSKQTTFDVNDIQLCVVASSKAKGKDPALNFSKLLEEPL